MKTQLFIILLLVTGLITVTGCTPKEQGPTITVYKSAQCGCCVGYVAELEKAGYTVETKIVDDMNVIKQQYGIERDMQSCHTAVVDGYFIEGHVPIEAVQKLLAERPDIDGIALPNMPAGSPGMPGTKSGPWAIYALADGESTEFVTI